MCGNTNLKSRAIPNNTVGENFAPHTAGPRAISETSTVDQGGNESRRPTPSNASSTGPSRLPCRDSGSLPKRRHLLPDGSGTARLIAFVIYQLRTITAPAIGLLCAATFSNTSSLLFLVICYTYEVSVFRV